MNILTRFRNAIAVAALSMLCLSPVWADDTEIYFGNFSGGGVSPNVLFIVDTSGSMSNSVPGTGMTRMQNVQEAMKILMNNLNDVNVGLMRFSNPGGPVLHEIDYIDRNLVEIEDALVDVEVPLVAANDDAQQTLGGEMIVDAERLDMVARQAPSAGTVVVPVVDGSDDAEEQTWQGWGDNVLRLDGDLEMTHDDGDSGRLHVVGVRFRDVEVPPGATITRATIDFTVDNVGAGGRAQMRITAEARDSGTFADVYNNISTRTKTSAFRNWNLRNRAARSVVTTPDLANIVQEVVDHPEWSGMLDEENDITFIFERRPGSNRVAEHDFEAYDKWDGTPPTLTIEYANGPPTAADSMTTGLRFQNVMVPRGVDITSAYIDFSVGLTDAGESTTLQIYGEDSATPADYSTGTITSRTRTPQVVSWDSIPTWDTTNDQHTTPNLASIVQSIVNRGDWCGGNDMAFVIDGYGLRTAWSRDANNGRQPVLRVQYEQSSIEPGATCTGATLSKQITSGMDDVEEQGNNVWTSSTDLDFDGSSRRIGLRFTNLNLPPGATINSAYLEFTPWENASNSGTIRIEVENTGDAAAFANSNGTVDNRSWSGTTVDWNYSSNWSTNQRVKSADISALVRLAVDNPSWAMGNDIAFRLRKVGGSTRRADTYDEDPVNAPRLVVNFQDDGTYSGVRLVRNEIIEQVDGLNTRGYTPIQDVLYEAALYYTGGGVDHGLRRGGPNDDGPHAYTRVSTANSMVDGSFTISRPTGCEEGNLGAPECAGEVLLGNAGASPTYKSPINDWCQANNHIILLTDGAANRPHSESKIKSFIGEGSCDSSYAGSGGGYHNVDDSEACGLDLVRYLYENDQSPLKETQRVVTHTIGFNFSSPWLAALAQQGGGQYREANRAEELVSQIEKILSQVLKTNSTFVSPVAAINQYNRLNHRSEIYFAVFRPEETAMWPGNLKKYRLSSTDNEVLDFSADPGKPAVNPDTGFFAEDAQSAWGGVIDGKEVRTGGANSKIPNAADRKVYTYYSGSPSTNLSNTANLLHRNNSNLTKNMFGVGTMTDAEFGDLIDWIRGRDVYDEDADSVTTENRYVISDPLHSKPAAVTYGGSEENPDITVFFGTNGGFLHAVDSATGIERFSFMPEELFGMQDALRQVTATQEHAYGIDGSVTTWINDANGDGSISGTGEFVRLIFGMRRGGRNYYALDVTDRDKPKMMWSIKGGAGDFAHLGQSWSQPILGTILIGSTPTKVLYFAGGYDPDQDDLQTRSADDMGNAIYIVNAETGALIWKGGKGESFTKNFEDMHYSIPGDMAVVDVTNSGLDNMMFVGDLGGQVWRFDIQNGESGAALINGGVVADLGVASGDNTIANHRRFYHSPDVALIDHDGATQLAVMIGSGYHAHPLSTGTTDRFYMFRQQHIYQAPSTYTKLEESDLYDASAGVEEESEGGEGGGGVVVVPPEPQGWYFDLPHTDEKVLSTPLTFKDVITFTTYQPDPSGSSETCIPAAGVSRVYQVRLDDASAVNNWDDIEGITEDDRGTALKTSSIVDEPVIICTDAGCNIFVGAEKPPVDSPDTDRVIKAFWRQE